MINVLKRLIELREAGKITDDQIIKLLNGEACLQINGVAAVIVNTTTVRIGESVQSLRVGAVAGLVASEPAKQPAEPPAEQPVKTKSKW